MPIQMSEPSAHKLLGRALASKGQRDEDLQHLRTAHDLYKRYAGKEQAEQTRKLIVELENQPADESAPSGPPAN